MRFIGPHVSIKENIALSVERAYGLGATGFAIFTKNQRIWSAPELKEADARAFKENMARYGFNPSSVLPHAGYLINPATPDPELREKSLALFTDEAQRTAALGLSVINIHPGAYKEGDPDDGLKRASSMIDEVLRRVPSIRIAIENTAGAGTITGSTFEELDKLLTFASEKDRIGFTLDTAHLFGSGYDVRNEAGKILDSFVSRFGKDKLFGMHLNDSKVPLASHKDRHESIGLGLIGKDAFMTIIHHSATDNIPLILETPDESRWKDEVKMLLEL
ncbi:MAG: deoxyribonuclease IV [Spirochaetes bacterium]|uniref:Probable endonuclease 4 n=1 Tax=Candidatus Ornithospirochaeta stercoripullorum TaxID=2840899 RepID=A0A9D9DZS5_9SPIO|nr:deoxyribonuclease IV [Candidatus Ornithospirochaeta stercoripullorum]